MSAVAKEFGMSPIPVREALRSLAAEGLVDLIPNRGAVVRQSSLDDVREVFLVRLSLETLALRLAIPMMSINDIRRLRNLVDAMDREFITPTAWLELNQRFHLSLYERSNLPRLQEMITALWIGVRPYLGVYMANAQTLRKARREHIQLLTACRTRDVDRAVQILEEHLSDTRDIVIAALRKSTDAVGG